MLRDQNMTDQTISGTVHTIEDTRTYGEKGFRKRLLVITQKRGNYANYIPIDLLGDACEAANDIERGDRIRAEYRLSGRRWQRDEASEVRFFISVESRSFERTEMASAAVEATPETVARSSNDEQDVPF